MTIREAAARWGRDPYTVRRMIVSGQIEATLVPTPAGAWWDIPENAEPPKRYARRYPRKQRTG